MVANTKTRGTMKANKAMQSAVKAAVAKALASYNGVQVNGATSALIDTAPAVPLAELTFVSLEKVVPGAKSKMTPMQAAMAAKVKFNNGSGGRFIYKNELKALVAAAKAGLLDNID